MLYNQNWNIPTNPVREILLRAADLMEKHGHVKYTRQDSHGRMCFLGAVVAAEQDNAWGVDTPLTVKASEAFCKAVNAPVREVGLSFTRDGYRFARAAAEWNNQLHITGDDVIAGMRLAADQVLEKEKVDAV